MSDQTPTEPSTKPEEKPATADLSHLLAGLQPYIPLLGQIATAVKGEQARSTNLTTVLLIVIVLCLCGLAGYALFMDHVDTAEKVIIALVSFLGGTAMFGGGTKK